MVNGPDPPKNGTRIAGGRKRFSTSRCEEYECTSIPNSYRAWYARLVHAPVIEEIVAHKPGRPRRRKSSNTIILFKERVADRKGTLSTRLLTRSCAATFGVAA